MAVQSRAALDGVAAALLVVYVGALVVSAKLSSIRHPKFMVLAVFSMVRIATAGLQINMDTASWQHRSAWLVLVDAGLPMLSVVLASGGTLSALAATGRIASRGWTLGPVIVFAVITIIFRGTGAVKMGRRIADNMYNTTSTYIAGESLNYITVSLTTVFTFLFLPRMLKRRQGGYAHTISPATAHGGLWSTFINRGLTREQVMAKYQDPHYLIWYFTSVALIPMLIALLVFSVLCTYFVGDSPNDTFFPLSPNVGLVAGLCYIPEAIIVGVLLFVGWKMPDDPYVAASQQGVMSKASTASTASTAIEMQPVDN